MSGCAFGNDQSKRSGALGFAELVRSEFSNLKGVKELKAGIEEECKRFGTVSTIDVNESDGVARVEFASLYDAACALLGTHGRTLDGNVVNVKYVY